MIHSISIDGYRGFRSFRMDELGSVNLLVGKNNSGKTSVLEAMYLLASGGDPFALWRILSRRGERVDIEGTSRSPPEIELDISHLFCGHELRTDRKITLATKNGAPDRSITYRLIERTQSPEQEALDEEVIPVPDIPQSLALSLTGVPPPMVRQLPLTRHGGIRSEVLDGSRRLRRDRSGPSKPAQYVTTESLSIGELAVLWNQIVLTDSEELVLEALRFLEPRIERIAAITSPSHFYYGGSERGGFRVKLREIAHPVPIGSLGDGTWRMLALAMALIRSKDGVLLIDEIDTGLHYSVMSDMWSLVVNTSRAFNVQVFATTHSYDCIQSLATVCHHRPNESDRITIQRIEAGKKRSVPYSEAEIRTAAERHIEIR